MKKIVILMGAGAASPWGGLSSKKIKELFILDDEYKIRDITFGKFIFKLLEDFYGSKDVTFETFIATLESILYYVINSTNKGYTSPNNTSIDPAILKVKDEFDCIFQELKNDDEKIKYFYDRFLHYTNIVINHVSEYNEKVPLQKNINTNLLKFTKYLLTHNYSVKYYTTNYDNIIPQVLSKEFEIYEGFQNPDEVNKQFNYDLEYFKEKTLTHFNLHGSVFLNQQIINKNIGYELETISERYPQQLLYTTIINGGNISEKLHFSPVIQGYRKTQRINIKPFNLGFSAFINDCNDCDILLTIGVSFLDCHINSILSSFINWNKVKFINVTLCNSKFNSSILNEEIAEMSFNQNEENDVWLHNYFNTMHVYKKGVKEFFKNSLNWQYIS